MADRVETVVIGGGQAGLAVSYYLGRQGREHVVLEQSDHPGSAWRDHRWDSFTLNTPNWQTRMPGAAYDGDDPDGFMSRDEVVGYLERYAERFGLPVRYGSRVATVEPGSRGGSYLVTTTRGVSLRTRNVVIATGLYQHPRIPALGAELPPDIRQVHSDAYRNPAELLPGAVLVVGSAQSGCQIAEELYRSGKKVYLAVGRSGRVPRRYRGKDTNWWSERLGLYDRTVDELPTPRAKFFPKPHISGKDRGHTINLHQFAHDGVVLLGHLQGVDGDRIILAPDLAENLLAADRFEAAFVKAIDDHIARGDEVDAPLETLPALRDGFAALALPSLNLRHAGISNVVWATSYGFDFSLVKLPVLDADGYPIQRRGVTSHPGLYFVGLPWLWNARSGLLYGAEQDAGHVARAILADERCLVPVDLDDVPARAWVGHDLCCS
jgi:putative flavoprotein involved in K+ transport